MSQTLEKESSIWPRFYIMPNNRRPNRCIECNEFIEDESSDHDSLNMFLVTDRQGTKHHYTYRGITIQTIVPHCVDCRCKGNKRRRTAYDVSWRLMALGVILLLAHANARLSTALILIPIAVMAIWETVRRRPRHARIIRHMRKMGFHRSDRHRTNLEAIPGLDKRAILRMMATLCAQHDYVLQEDKVYQDLLSVEILRDKGYIDPDVAASIIDRDYNTRPEDIDIGQIAEDIDLDLDIDPSQKLYI